MSERQPIEHVLPGMTIEPLDEGSEPLQAFILIRLTNPDETSTWAFRTTSPFNLEELLGALTIQTELVKRSLMEEWEVP